MSKLFLLNIGEILIDKIDIVIALSSIWSLTNSGYIQGTSKYRHQYLHRIIAERVGLDLSNDIDHEDRNKLNNQRNNLRPATRSQNNGNSVKHSNNSSGLKGAFYSNGKYFSRIRINNQQIYLGCFDTVEEAHEAYCKAATEYFGEFARFK